MSDFAQEVNGRIVAMSADQELKQLALAFMRASTRPKYSYNFSWLGCPIIQYPQDMVAMQELIWTVKPDLIIETGIAHGGSLIMNASLLALLDVCEASAAGTLLDARASRRLVLGIDIDIRPYNRAAIEKHPLASRIRTIEGSSIDAHVVRQVREFAERHNRVLVCLDSNHTHDHVLGGTRSLCAADEHRQLLRRIRHDRRRPAEGDVPRPTWGPGSSSRTAVANILAPDLSSRSTVRSTTSSSSRSHRKGTSSERTRMWWI